MKTILRKTIRPVRTVLAGLFIFLLWCGIVFWIIYDRQHMLDQYNQVLERTLLNTEYLISRIFIKTEITLLAVENWISTNPGLDPRIDPHFIDLVEKIRKASDNTIDIRLVSKKGGIFYIPAVSEKPLADVSDREYYRVQMSDKTRGYYVSRPILSRVNKKWGIPVSIPLPENPHRIAVAFTSIDKEKLDTIFQEQGYMKNINISLFRKDGRMLSIYPPVNWEEEIKSPDDKTIREYLPYFPDKSGIIKSVSDTGLRLVSIATIKGYPVGISVSVSMNDVFRGWIWNTLATAASGIIFTLLIIFIRSREARFNRTLSKSQQMIELVLNHVPASIFFKDTSSVYLGGNRSFLNNTGLDSVEELIGKTNHDFLPEEAAEKTLINDRKVIETNTPLLNMEEHVMRADGEERILRMNLIPLNDSKNNVIGIIGIFEDITDWKKIEIDKEKLISELREALSQVDTLSGLLPICSSCKKIRDGEGNWEQIESYIRDRSDVDFTHSLCPECAEKLYPEFHKK